MPEPNPESLSFTLTPRQRRLRVFTVVIVLFVIAMILFGMTHPFFRPRAPEAMTPRVRDAFRVQVLIVGFYWTACMLMATSLIVIAWLDVREIRRKIGAARRQIAEESLRRSIERAQERPPHPHDDG
jgi:hypothetical protein